MASVYTHVDKNKRETWIIMVLFTVVVTFLGWLIGVIQGEGYATVYISIALIFSGLSSFFSYYNSDKLVLAISKARPVGPVENEYLHNILENLCIGSGLPVPKLYMIDDTAMNAFATGRDPEHAVIVVTSGIVDKLDRVELEGVLAHELSHVGNYDIRLMSIVSVLVGSVSLIVNYFTRGMFYKRRSKSSSSSSASGFLMILALVFVILSPIIATLIKLAISRRREYLADSSAALLTRFPQGLANALKKLAQDKEVLEAANSATAHLYIADPLKNGGASKFFANLYNTHPPIEDRIQRLESM